VTALLRTPLLRSTTLGEAFGGTALLKAELFQKTGSFKPRGILAKLATLTPEEKERGVITVSAGNAAAAVAYGCALEKIDCLVVMWQGTSDLKAALRAASALEFGGVTVNEAPTFRADQMPYGGVKDSGNTREGPAYAVREMTEERLVVLQL